MILRPIFQKTKVWLISEAVIGTREGAIALHDVTDARVQPAFNWVFGSTNDLVLSMSSGRNVVLSNLRDDTLDMILRALREQQPSAQIETMPLFITGKRTLVPDSRSTAMACDNNSWHSNRVVFCNIPFSLTISPLLQ